MNKAYSNNNVVAALATLNPDALVLERICDIAAQVREIVIGIDDSSPEKEAVFTGKTPSNALLVPIAGNIGIGAVLNRAVEHSSAGEQDLLLFLDDDSDLHAHFVSNLLQAIASLEIDLFRAVVGPTIINVGATSDLRNPRTSFSKILAVEKIGLISSGMLTSYRLFVETGKWNEPLFIDCVDFEFCIRARRSGAKIFKLTEVMMLHRLGDSTFHQLIWRTVSTSNHSAIRRRYFIRNSLYVAANNFQSEPKYALGVLLTQIRTILFIVLFERDKYLKLSSIGLGYLDFLRGRSGKIR